MLYGLMPLQVSPDSASGGIDIQTFWFIISGMAGVIGTLASLLYRNERERRIAAELKLEKFHEIAPDLAENVRWLVEKAELDEQGELSMPWPTTRPSQPTTPQLPTAPRRTRRRSR